MQSIAVDTCVFFRMIDEYQFLLVHGQADFAKKQEFSQYFMQCYQEQIESKMVKEYKATRTAQGGDYVEWVHDYLRFIKNKLRDNQKFIARVNHKEAGYIMVNGVKYPQKAPTPSELAAREDAKKIIQECAALGYNEEEFKNLRENYKFHKETLAADALLEKAMRQEISLHVTPTVYAEVQNHIQGKTNLPSGVKTFAEEHVNQLTHDLFTLIKIDQEVENRVLHLSSKYRRPLLGELTSGTPMANDINSLDRFGDSLIMAESAIAGFPLVTFNIKDFIWDKSRGISNDLKRQHIARVNRESLISDALPYSIREIVQGIYHQPTRRSSGIYVDNTTIPNQNLECSR